MNATTTPAADATALPPGSLEFYANAQPDKVAIVDKNQALTWRQWNDQANRLAAALAARGIKPGDRVAVRMRTRAEWFVAYQAISKLGASQVGLNWRLTAPESEYILSDSQTKAIIFDDEDGEALYDAWAKTGIATTIPLEPLKRPGVVTFRALIDGASNAPTLITKMRAPLILYTSGTTGKPKGAFPDPSLLMPRIKEVMEYRADVEAAVPVQPGARCLATLPMHHGAGPGSTFPSLAVGGVAFLMDRFEPEAALQLIEREKITNWTAVPTMLHRMRALPEETQRRYDVSSIRVVTLGASAVPFALKQWAVGYFGSHCLYEGYGSTETGMLTYISPEDQLRKPGSSGTPRKHVRIKIIDDNGNELPRGETGEICAYTPITIDRYLGRDVLGPDAMTPDGYFRLGDVGRHDPDGHVYVTDRKKDMIVAGGVNIYPAEIEAVLVQHPDIVDAAVIGIPHDSFGEQVMAFCELKAGATGNPDGILDLCRGQLAPYKLPRKFEFVGELPRNSTGKVLKTELRAPYWAGRERNV